MKYAVSVLLLLCLLFEGCFSTHEVLRDKNLTPEEKAYARALILSVADKVPKYVSEHDTLYAGIYLPESRKCPPSFIAVTKRIFSQYTIIPLDEKTVMNMGANFGITGAVSGIPGKNVLFTVLEGKQQNKRNLYVTGNLVAFIPASPFLNRQFLVDPDKIKNRALKYSAAFFGVAIGFGGVLVLLNLMCN